MNDPTTERELVPHEPLLLVVGSRHFRHWRLLEKQTKISLIRCHKEGVSWSPDTMYCIYKLTRDEKRREVK